MYQTLDGEWTCECCTLDQNDGEIPDGAVWMPVDAECYICAREGREAARQALADFAKAAAALNGLWQLHCDGSAIDRALCDAYPEGWESFDAVEAQIRRWAGKVHDDTPEQWTGPGRYVYTDGNDRTDLGVLDRPVDLEVSLAALGAWTGTVDRVHCPACHDDPAGCAECPHCPDCGDPMRDHEEG